MPEPGTSPGMRLAVIATCLAVLVLTFASPVDTSDSDPALALVAAQALVEHGTLDLSVFSEDPRLSYDLDADRRVERRGEGLYYYSLGLPLLSAPAVWIANRLGSHMLDLESEKSLQNLLSALVCAILALVVYGVCRQVVSAGAALLIAGSTTFGSALVSTLGTALWSAGPSTILLSLALYLSLRSGQERPPVPAVAALVTAAFLIRPTAAFFAIAFVLSGTLRNRRQVFVGLGALLGSWGVVLAVGSLGLLDWLPSYYSWRKLQPVNPLPLGLTSHLLSASRGLLVFSPFVAVVLAACWTTRRHLVTDRWFRCIVWWFSLHLTAVSIKTMWWGGHAFGPRLLVEIVPGIALGAALAWRELRAAGSAPAWATAFLAAAVPALLINTGQGLFNPAVVRWNSEPEIDRDALRVFDWVYPQFLATPGRNDARSLRYDARRLEPLPWDTPVRHDDEEHLAFSGWGRPESDWRWTTRTEVVVAFLLRDVEPARLHVLELTGSSNGRQTVHPRLNGVTLETLALDGAQPDSRLIEIPENTVLNGQNRLVLDIPGASPAPGDDRALGLALRSMTFWASPGRPKLRFDQHAFFGDGFSAAETAWRWTDGPRAEARLLVGDLDPARPARLVLLAGSLGEQEVVVVLGERRLGSLHSSGFAPAEHRIEVPAGVLRSNALNDLRFLLPDARTADGDDRLLGIAFVELTVEPGPL